MIWNIPDHVKMCAAQVGVTVPAQVGVIVSAQMGVIVSAQMSVTVPVQESVIVSAQKSVFVGGHLAYWGVLDITQIYRQCLSSVTLTYLRLLLNYARVFCCQVYSHGYVSRECQRVALFLGRRLFLKHDFKLQIQQLLLLCEMCTAISILVQLIFYHVFTFQYIKYYVSVWLTGLKCTSFNIHPRSKSSTYIGGGSNLFSFQELQPYLVGESNTYAADDQFKFKKYVIGAENPTFQCSVKSTCICDIPLTSILYKLTVSDLCMLAGCHGIFTHSKMRSVEIQTLINSHMCKDCKHYLYLFEMVGKGNEIGKNNERNMKAVKKYQTKQGVVFKQKNLTSVKMYQSRQGNAYKTAHLKAAKKYLDKSGKNYQVTHLESVKKKSRK